MKTDESLARELVKLKEKLEKSDKKFLDDEYVVNEKIIPLAKKHGVSFTADEFMSYTKEKLTELSEEDLLNVSGGVGLSALCTSVFLIFATVMGGTTWSAMRGKPETISVAKNQQDESETMNHKNNASNSENEEKQNKEKQQNSKEEVVISKFSPKKSRQELEETVSRLEKEDANKLLKDDDYNDYMDFIAYRYPRFSTSFDDRLMHDLDAARKQQLVKDEKEFTSQINELKAELEKVNNELKQSKQDNEELKDRMTIELSNAETRINNTSQENVKLKNENLKLKSNLEKAKTENKSKFYKGEKAAEERLKKTYEAQRKILLSDLEQQKQKYEELQKSNDELKKVNNGQSEKIKVSEEEISKIKATYQEELQENKENQEKIEKLESEAKANQERIENLEENIKIGQQKLVETESKSEKEKNEMQKNINELNKNLSTLQENNKKLESQLTQQTENAKKASDLNEEYKKQIAEVNGEKESLQKEFKAQSDNIIELREEIEKVKAEKERLQKVNKEQSEQIKNSVDEIAKVKKASEKEIAEVKKKSAEEITKLKEEQKLKLSKLKVEVEKMIKSELEKQKKEAVKAAMTPLKVNINNLSNAFNKQLEEIKQLEQVVNEKQKTIDNQTEENEALKQEIEQLKAQLAEQAKKVAYTGNVQNASSDLGKQSELLLSFIRENKINGLSDVTEGADQFRNDIRHVGSQIMDNNGTKVFRSKGIHGLGAKTYTAENLGVSQNEIDNLYTLYNLIN